MTRETKKDSERVWHYEGEVEGKLSQSLSYKVNKFAGVTNHIGFTFPRHGVFQVYGVGSGQPIGGGGNNIKIKRKMTDWFDAPIDANFENLADIAADFYGDMFIVNMHNSMKINKS